MDCHEPHPAPNEKTQPIQWTERPTGALVGANSLWPGQMWLELGFLLGFSCWLKSYDECWAVFTNGVSYENGHFKNCLGYHLVQTLIFGAVMGWTIRFSTHPSRDLKTLVETI
jgi:hypothetical protein